jgi:hypothetical protein
MQNYIFSQFSYLLNRIFLLLILFASQVLSEGVVSSDIKATFATEVLPIVAGNTMMTVRFVTEW